MSTWFRAFLISAFLLASMPHDHGRWLWWVDLIGGVCWLLIGLGESWAALKETRSGCAEGAPK